MPHCHCLDMTGSGLVLVFLVIEQPLISPLAESWCQTMSMLAGKWAVPSAIGTSQSSSRPDKNKVWLMARTFGLFLGESDGSALYELKERVGQMLLHSHSCSYLRPAGCTRCSNQQTISELFCQNYFSNRKCPLCEKENSVWLEEFSLCVTKIQLFFFFDWLDF